MRNKGGRIPWARPVFWGKEKEYVTAALESTWISGGPYIERLENHVGGLLKKKHALAVCNGTAAIQLAYLGLGLRPGDEVIVPGFAFMAAANVALHMGLKPVFGEVDEDTWCLAARDLPRCISSRTRAIVPVHTYGNVCAMEELMEIADSDGIAIVEDCAESLFSRYKGKYCGTFGKISAFSFHATKTVTTGEGGLVGTDSDEVYRRMALYRSHGMDRERKFYWHEVPGHNFRLTNLQAAMGVAQLEKADSIVSERRRVYGEYRRHLEGVEGVTLQGVGGDVEPVIWAVGVKLDGERFPQGRDRVMEQLGERGVETRPGFYASSQLEIYEKHSLPVCERISANVLSLPSFPTLENDEVAFICRELLDVGRQ